MDWQDRIAEQLAEDDPGWFKRAMGPAERLNYINARDDQERARVLRVARRAAIANLIEPVVRAAIASGVLMEVK